MNGGQVHEYSLDLLEGAFRAKGARVSRQVPMRVGRRPAFVDLVVHSVPRPLAIEVEMSPRRVPNDILKAKSMDADLWIVVPHQRVVAAVRRKLRRELVRETEAICVLTLGLALQRVGN